MGQRTARPLAVATLHRLRWRCLQRLTGSDLGRQNTGDRSSVLAGRDLAASDGHTDEHHSVDIAGVVVGSTDAEHKGTGFRPAVPV